MQLGRLEKVGLREVWKTEAQHFTPWLAQEENLALLGDKIGLEVELWRIGESAIAPKFNIVSKANEWTMGKAGTARVSGAKDLSNTKKLQLESSAPWANIE